MKTFSDFIIISAIALMLGACSAPQGKMNPGRSDSTPSDNKESTPTLVAPQEKPPVPPTTDREIPRVELTAGSHNDNEEFVRYLEYLARFAHLPVLRLDVGERYIVQLKDRDGSPVPNCRLSIDADGRNVARLITSSSGEVVFFPNAMSPGMPGNSFTVSGEHRGRNFGQTFMRGAEGVVSITLPTARAIETPVPLDIVFLLDTTGSMGDEIQRLKDTLFSIHHRITEQMRVTVSTRFGMVLYRDVGDAYVTKVEPLTGDIEYFQRALDQVQAGGGGDKPEELEEGLEKALTTILWNPNGIRLVFAITDAPPHTDRRREKNYLWAAQEAARQGIKIYTVGASGLDEIGEYVLRQLAIFTQAHYIFLTYGEKGESDSPEAKVSHHTGANYEVALLDTLIVRMIRRELSYLVEPGLIREEEIPTPVQVNAAEVTERIHNLVEQVHHQIRKQLEEQPLIAIFPLHYEPPKRFRNVAEYIKDSVEQEMKYLKCRLLERDELKRAIRERMIAAGNTLDDEQISEISKIEGADIFLTGKIYPLGESVVIFLQAVDVHNLQKIGVARVLWTPEK